ARELLSARRPRSPDRCLRRVLQPPALSREHQQSNPGRRLLRARPNHPARKRKDQTQNHPKSSVASSPTSRITSNQDAPDHLLDQAASCLKISDDGQSLSLFFSSARRCAGSLRTRYLLMAQSGRVSSSEECPLSGVKARVVIRLDADSNCRNPSQVATFSFQITLVIRDLPALAP